MEDQNRSAQKESLTAKSGLFFFNLQKPENKLNLKKT